MEAAIEGAFSALTQAHHLMSFHQAGSDISRLNREAWRKPVRVHAWTYQVLQSAIDLHRHSAGLFDIAIVPILQRMGLLPRAHHDRPPSSGAPATSEAIELLPGSRVCFKHRTTTIDVGGIAKGFAVDCAIGVLRAHGMPVGLVNAGGDLAVFGPSPHPIYVRDPRDARYLLCRVDVSNAALASSGRRFDPLVSSRPLDSAVIDPRKRCPVRTVLGATVHAPSCMIADALTKVVMIAGLSAGALLDRYRAGAFLVGEDGRVMTRDLDVVTCLAA
jgi:thiamine biosynthesis lipoprotein